MDDPGDSTPSAFSAEPPAEAEPPERLRIAIVADSGDWSGFPNIESEIEATAAALSCHASSRRARGAEASVVLASDEMVRGLNRSYRGKDTATNVLSFPFQLPPGITGEDEPYLGDVVLAAKTIAAEAAARGIAPIRHVQHLVVHGLLHLLGFEHESDAQAEVMERLEVEILSRLGIADPYALAVVD